MTSQEQQAKVVALRVAYRCRRCSETYSGGRDAARVVRDCLDTVARHPSETAHAAWGNLVLAPIGVHSCQDGGLGISDLLGADPDD